MEAEIYKMFYEIHIVEKVNELKILGDEFVKNNKNRAKLIIKNKKIHLKNKLHIYRKYDIKIKMILVKNVQRLQTFKKIIHKR